MAFLLTISLTLTYAYEKTRRDETQRSYKWWKSLSCKSHTAYLMSSKLLFYTSSVLLIRRTIKSWWKQRLSRKVLIKIVMDVCLRELLKLEFDNKDLFRKCDIVKLLVSYEVISQDFQTNKWLLGFSLQLG